MSHNSFSTQNAWVISAYLNSGEFDSAPYTDINAVRTLLKAADKAAGSKGSVVLLSDDAAYSVTVRRIRNEYKVTAYTKDAA